MRRSTLMAAAILLLGPAAADAHVTLQPDTAPAGGYTRLDVRVPNERDDAGTVKVDVQFPPGVEGGSYEPVPGWDVKVTRKGEQVSRIAWTGDGPRGVIEPGQFQDFGLSLKMPDGETGEELTFKALQTYEGGEVVRWIGPEDADEPAPVVTLEAVPEGGGRGAPAAAAPGGGPTAAAPAASDEGGTDALSIVALIVGALGLLAALAALAASRRGTVPSRRSATA